MSGPADLKTAGLHAALWVTGVLADGADRLAAGLHELNGRILVRIPGRHHLRSPGGGDNPFQVIVDEINRMVEANRFKDPRKHLR